MKHTNSTMNIKSKTLLLVPVLALLVLIFAITLFLISKSREFQFFGEIRNAFPNNENKIALTFDDGPTKNTEAIINRLSTLGIQATFFVCGAEVKANPEYAKAIAQAGHDIGNHSYSHKRMILKSYAFVKEEVDSTNDLIRATGYDREIFFRPPNGKKLFVLPYYLSQIGMKTIMWRVEPETVLGMNASPHEIAQYVINNVESGSVILLHPMYKTENVLAALDILVPELQKRGYTFSTISDLYTESR